MNAHHSECTRHIGILLLVLLLGACATSPEVQTSAATTPRAEYDPWEPLNRGVYGFNRGVDKVTLKPIATAYRNATPGFVQRGVSNFFANLRTPLTIINQLLQGKGGAAISDSGRLLLNTTLGIGGLFDPATAAGLEEHDEDFGQTLAVWGVSDGPFVMVPLLGPRTLRDALMIPLNLFADPLLHYDNSSVRDKLWALQAIQLRARLLAAESLIEDSLDPYVTVRESWLQNRRYLIHDGNPPEQEDEYLDEYLDE